MQTERQQIKEANKATVLGWVSMALSFLGGLLKTTPAEKQEGKAIKIDNMVDKEKAKQEVRDVKRGAKIEKRIAKAKKSIPVKRLKEGKLIYIQYFDEEGVPEEKKRKEIFKGFTVDYVITDHGQHVYTNVFNWHGRPVLGPEINTDD